MRNKKAFVILITLSQALLFSCSNPGGNSSSSSSSSSEDNILIYDIDTHVYEKGIYLENYIKTDLKDEKFNLLYEGNDIRIDNNNVIVGLKANTITEVTLETLTTHKIGTFEVSVINRDYTSRHTSTETSEAWFNDVTIDSITKLTTSSSYVNGIDISSSALLYENEAQFYNEEGDEESLYYLLKRSGVSDVRLRIWNDPTDGSYEYGGGGNNLERTKWMVKEITSAGLKYTLDFHYSDFWTDPTHQVLPKAWKDLTSVTSISNALYSYTKETLLALGEVGDLPTMVQIGNEINRGLLTELPGGSQSEPNGNFPKYVSESYNQISSLGGWAYSDALISYIKSGIKAVKEVDSSIKTILHYAKGLSGYDNIITFFNQFSAVDYDVIGLSGYSYYQFKNISTLKTGLEKISAAFLTKKILIAETSYGFTYEKDNYANNVFDSSDVSTGYPASIQGQAKMYRDILEATLSISNGIGVFYWEGAWTCKSKCGWSDSLSLASWANQGFFSYDGKALGSLQVFSKVYQDWL